MFAASRHSMTLSIIKKLFFIKTESPLIRGKAKNKPSGIQKYLCSSITDMISNQTVKSRALKEHRAILLSTSQVIKLFFANLHNQWLVPLGFSCFKPIRSELVTLYEECEKRLNHSLNVIKVLKDIKYMKLLLKFKLDPDVETKFQVYHCSKNVIDLDNIYRNKIDDRSDQEMQFQECEAPPCNQIDEYLVNKRRKTVKLKEQILLQ